MPFDGITQIPYDPCSENKPHLTNQQVNDLLVFGHPCSAEYVKAQYLKTANAPFSKTPAIFEFTVLLEGRKKANESDPRELKGRLLYARFRPDFPGIDTEFSKIDPQTQPNRHIAAYSVSMSAGVEVVPISVKRNFSDLNNTTHTSGKNPLARLALAGPGTLTAYVKGLPLFVHNFDLGRKVIPESLAFKRKTLIAALLFDLVIGSGQRDASSYLVDEDGRVRTVYHQEAFTYTAQKQLCEHLAQEFPEVSIDFWEALRKIDGVEAKKGRLEQELAKYLHKDEIADFFSKLNLLLKNRRVCGQEIITG